MVKHFTNIKPSHPSFKREALEVLSLEELAQDHREGPATPRHQHQTLFFLIYFFNVCLFLRETETGCEWVRGRERG